MHPIKRLLFTIPFVVVSFLYLRLRLADNGGYGLVDFIYTQALFVLFAVAFPLALAGALKKRKAYNGKPEPYTLGLVICTFLILIGGVVFGEKLKGKTWIYAESKSNGLIKQTLTLRHNGTYRIDVIFTDFGAYFSGNYQKNGDTILFPAIVKQQTDSAFTTLYLLKDSMLLPIINPSLIGRIYEPLIIVAPPGKS